MKREIKKAKGRLEDRGKKGRTRRMKNEGNRKEGMRRGDKMGEERERREERKVVFLE